MGLLRFLLYVAPISHSDYDIHALLFLTVYRAILHTSSTISNLALLCQFFAAVLIFQVMVSRTRHNDELVCIGCVFALPFAAAAHIVCFAELKLNAKPSAQSNLWDKFLLCDSCLIDAFFSTVAYLLISIRIYDD